MTTRATLTPGLLLNGQPFAPEYLDALLSLSASLSVHTAGTAHLTFEDPFLDLFDRATVAIGMDLTIKVPDAVGTLSPVFAGKVTGVGIEDDRASGKVGIRRLVVEAHDGSQALAASATHQAYLNGAEDVVEAIAARHGLTAMIVGSLPVTGYVLQSGTDHAMLTELARRCGYEWFTNGTELHFRPRPTPSGPTLSRSDGTLLRFSARYTGLTTPSSLDVHGWDPIQGEAHSGRASDALSGTPADLGSDAAFVRDQHGKAKSTFGKALAVGDTGSRDAQEADAIAEGLARELVGAGLSADGTAPSNPAIVAGSYVVIDDMGAKLTGSYYVTDVTHEFGADKELLTHFRCGGHVVEPAPWGPGFGSGTWADRGPVVGVVDNLNDPDGIGRVKVRFPSLGDAESEWARVVSVGAGTERGIDFRPEIEDEVLVAFERGDPRFPLVLGGLWSRGNALARTDHVANGEVNSRIITSRLGHTIELADGAAAADQHVTVTLAGGTKLALSEETGIQIDVATGDLELRTAGGSIILTQQGELTVDVDGKATIKAAQDVKVESSLALELKGATGGKLDGGPNLEIKSSGMGKVEASGILEVKGAMVKVN